MKRLLTACAIAGALASFVPFAEARHQITATVPKGKPTYITDSFSCSGGAVPAKITEPPRNGTAEVVVVREAVSAKKLNSKRAISCEGVVVDIHYVKCTPNPGYTGPDQIGVDWEGGLFGGKVYRYPFVVK